MPEFILDMGDSTGANVFASLDSFAQGYVEAMFFTDTGTGDDAENGLEDASVAELASETLDKIKADCARFQELAADLLANACQRDDYDMESAGRDFWYTRNGHGVGFWDRKTLSADGLGDALSALCGWHTAFGELSVYRGDDGLIYLS